MDANSCVYTILHSYILKINIQDIQSIKSPGFFRLAKSSVVCLKHLKPPKSGGYGGLIIIIIAIIMTYNDHLGE